MNPLRFLYPSLPFRAWLCGKPTTYDGEPDPLRTLVFERAKAAGLKQNDIVLDIGCSDGKLARRIIPFLTSGEYRGFDIVKSAVQRATEELGPHFTHVDAYNLLYNPHGRINSNRVVFPYKDGTFSFVIANSVFTHMLPEGVSHYLSESFRVCKNGARAVFTFFIFTKERNDLHDSKKCNSAWKFRNKYNGYRTLRKHVGRENAVAYDLETIKDMVCKSGFRIDEISYGHWFNPAEIHSGVSHFQDGVVLSKP